MNQVKVARLYKSRWFERFARKEGITDSALRHAVNRANWGQIDADLGGGVIKQRIARPGQGRSSGCRVIIFFQRGARALFIYGFSKNDRANIAADEERQFKAAAKHVLALNETELTELVRLGEFLEVL